MMNILNLVLSKYKGITRDLRAYAYYCLEQMSFSKLFAMVVAPKDMIPKPYNNIYLPNMLQLIIGYKGNTKLLHHHKVPVILDNQTRHYFKLKKVHE